MLKKITLISFALLLIFSIPGFAAVFTDVDSYQSFNSGGNPVWNDEAAGDYWVGEWDGGTVLPEAKIAVEQGKGWDGTAALAIWEEAADANQGMYLFVTANNGIATDYSGMVYLRVWMDLSDVAFRKANFGVTDDNYNLFTTDEENANASEWPLYYKADGSDTWETYYHGGDGCFGDAQDSDVAGFKGFFAFPVSDFVIRNNAANKSELDPNTAADMSKISGVYLFWDYSDSNMDYEKGSKFYLDNIEFVKDYKVFEGLIYDPPIIEEVIAPEETPAETTETAPVTETAKAPQTFDVIGMTFGLLGLSGVTAIFVGGKKRR